MWREFYRFDEILLHLLNLAKDYPLKKEIAVIQGLYLKAQIMKIKIKPENSVVKELIQLSFSKIGNYTV